MIRFVLRSACVVVVGLAFLGSGRVAGADTDKEVQKKKDLIKKVATKLLAVAEPVPGLQWPPDIAYVDSPKVNAFASATEKNGKLYPIVRVFDGMMTKVIEGDEDRLAFVLGHEIGHITKRHVLNRKGETALLESAFSRADEEEADAAGVELAVKAGYSFAKGVKMVTEMQNLGLDQSSFEGLDSSHPTWSDRAKRIDKEKSHLWKALSSFNNGAVFLALEQYSAAEQCFDRVTKEFPESYEGWANLGYACLMQYCDKLDGNDLREYGIGQIITGGFYFRAQSIKVRSKDTKLWTKAVSALQQSNKLKAGQTLVLANLGLANLVNPGGKNVAEANRLLSEAKEAAKSDTGLHPITNAGVLVNLGIANIADGKDAVGLAQLEEGEEMVQKFSRAAAGGRRFPTFDSSVKYTRAMTLAGSTKKADQEKAADLFEEYLHTCSPLSMWWPVAYERYEKVCKAIERKPAPKDEFKKDRTAPVRLVISIKLKSGAEVTLSEDVEDVEKKLGKGKEITAATGLKRIRYENEGIELLTRDEVLAIVLTDPKAPGIPLRGRMVGAESAGTIKVGMTVKEVEALLGDEYEPCEIATAGLSYRFYRPQGLALRVIKNEVKEVIIAQVPPE